MNSCQDSLALANRKGVFFYFGMSIFLTAIMMLLCLLFFIFLLLKLI